MRALVQRVSRATVHIAGNPHAAIGPGLLVFLGVEAADTADDAAWLAGKVARLRLFPDAAGVMNLSLLDTGGALLVVSQFTLHASTKKGNRPSYLRAAPPEISEPLYREFLRLAESELARPVASGVFGATMTVSLANEGPVTIWIDSKNRE